MILAHSPFFSAPVSARIRSKRTTGLKLETLSSTETMNDSSPRHQLGVEPPNHDQVVIQAGSISINHNFTIGFLIRFLTKNV